MKKILIIEDDRQLVLIYRQSLTDGQTQIVSAATGAEGLTLATQEHPDLILLDIMLPGGMNGFDILEQLKRTPALAAIPVIMLTNLDSEEKIAREIGVTDYLIKANTSLSDAVARIRQRLGNP